MLKAPVVDRKTIEHAVRGLLTALGRAADQDTPARAAESWLELLSGYDVTPDSILKPMELGLRAEQTIVVGPVEFYSVCEHHLLPFFGEAHVAYVARERIVGLSKIPRLVACHTRRLQVQERATEDIARDLFSHLKPVGCGVRLRAQHLCMCARGVRSSAHTETILCLGSMTNEQFLTLT